MAGFGEGGVAATTGGERATEGGVAATEGGEGATEGGCAANEGGYAARERGIAATDGKTPISLRFKSSFRKVVRGTFIVRLAVFTEKPLSLTSTMAS